MEWDVIQSLGGVNVKRVESSGAASESLSPQGGAVGYSDDALALGAVGAVPCAGSDGNGREYVAGGGGSGGRA